MIISLRGASGSGKSTMVRKITALFEGDGVPKYIDGRRHAYYTIHERARGKSLVVPGHYDIANGGVDTLGTLEEAYGVARMFDCETSDVLMEGKCMSDGQKHAIDLHRVHGRDIRIVHIDIPLRRCVGSVRQRGHQIAEHSIARTYAKVHRDVEAFREAGLRVFQGSRADCLTTVKNWLGLEG